MRVIDLRSDTVTKPTAAMRRAIAEAEVGDDVYGEDPSVNRLEDTAAALLGMEAAVLVPSGTMANQLAIRAHTSPGDQVLAAEAPHALRAESGGPAALSGVQVTEIGVGGLFTAADVRAAIPPDNVHFAPATLLAAENTHNFGGGRVFPFDQLAAAAQAAHAGGLATHLDGARLFNAVVATGIPADRWAGLFDTVSFCLSKGLGAPVGSLVCGSTDAIRRVRRFRKMFGGGMRQAGILAAAGLHALEHHVDRLAQDHEHAAHLARGLQEVGLKVDPEPETNIVMFAVESPQTFVAECRDAGVLVGTAGAGRIRAVLHLDVTQADVALAIDRIAAVAAGRQRGQDSPHVRRSP